MKTITYNPETHVLVPKGMMYEFPELPMPIKGKFSKDLFDGFQMHQYAMRYLDEAIAAAPQPKPNHNWCAGCSPDNCSGCDNYQVESKPVAEHELQDTRCECCGYMTYHREHMGCIRSSTPQPDRTAELEAALKEARDDIDEFLVANDPTEFGCACDLSGGYLCGPCHVDMQQQPLKSAIAKINEVLHD